MNISETSSCGRRDPITSIRAHISQKKKEFDLLSNTDDGQLLQEAFARAASGSRSGERRVKNNVKELSRTTDFQKSIENAYQNKYFLKNPLPNEYDLKNPVILKSSSNLKGKMNDYSQYIQVEKAPQKYPDSAGLRSNLDDNYSHETRSQFTDHFDFHQIVNRSRSS